MNDKLLMKQKSIRFFLLFLFLLTTGSSVAQKKVLTLEESINAALKNNTEIQVAVMNVKKSDAAVSEAFGYALPSVDLSAQFAHFLKKPKTPFPDFEALLTNATYSILFDENVIPRDNSKFRDMKTALQSFAQTNSYETSVQVTQTLFNSAVFRGIGASKIYSDLSKEELKRTVLSTVLGVKKAFFGVLLTKQMNEITKASYLNAQENLKTVKAAYDQGFVSEFDLLQAEVRVENIRPQVLQVDNTLKTALDGFKILIGMNQTDDIDVTGELNYKKYNLPDESASVEEALKSNYGLKSYALKIDVDEAFIDLDRSEYWPSLYAFGNYSYAGSSDNFKFQNYSSAIVGLTFSMNLFNGMRTANKVQQSEIALDQSTQQYRQMKEYVSLQVKAKLLEIQKVESLLEAQERNVTLAEKAYSISVTRYKEGTGSQIEVQNADIALQQARVNRLQSVYEYVVATSELDELLGKSGGEYFSLFEFED